MQEVIALTQKLIPFKSTRQHPEALRACADFIQHYLTSHNIAYEALMDNGIPSTLVLPANGFAKVLLMSHIDVVDGPDALFTPVVRDGRLFGRGSIDDKYAVALSLVLFKNRLQALLAVGKDQGEMPFGLLITGDEETGGYHGAKKGLARVTSDFCITLDGGSISKIVVKEKGFLRLKLTTKGKAAHAARPWLGINAIDQLVTDYLAIRRLFNEAPPDYWHKTINFGKVRAGKSINQVPDRAEAFFDIRYTENDNLDQLIKDIRNCVQGEIEIQELEPIFQCPPSPYLDLLLSVADGTTIGFEHGASDARLLSGFGIPGVVWGADGDLSQHTRQEHVNIDSVTTLYHLLDAFMDRAAAYDAEGKILGHD